MLLAIIFGILWLIVALLVVAAVLLLMPFKIWLRIWSTPSPCLRVDATVFGGFIPFVSVFDSERQRAKREEKTTRPAKSKHKKKKKRGASIASRFISAGPDLLSGILRAIQLEHLRLSASFGLGDPAETGRLYGWLTPFIYATPRSPAISIALRPDFAKACLSGELDTMVRFVPAAFIPSAVTFSWRVFGPKR